MSKAKVLNFNKEEAIEDAKIVSEEITKPMDPYIVVRRVMPETGLEDRGAATEGIRLPIPPDGKLNPAVVNGFLGDAYVTRLPDGRTVVLSTRLINNHIITESYSASSIDEFNEEYAVRVCQAKTKNRLLDMLEFMWACATYSPARMEAEEAHLAKFTPTGEVELPEE